MHCVCVHLAACMCIDVQFFGVSEMCAKEKVKDPLPCETHRMLTK